jgi:hypothetical protein
LTGYNSLRRSEKSHIDKALDMESGYVLDFSNRTIEIHFEDEFGLECYTEPFGRNGNSKANRLRTILGDHSGTQAARILRELWDYRSSLAFYTVDIDPAEEAKTKENFFNVVARLEGDSAQVDLEPFQSFDHSNALYELLQSIERDIRADKPQAAIDRLHLFCVKRFKHLLVARRITFREDEPLNSLTGKYKNALESEGKHSEMALTFIRYSIAVFEKFNDVRNNRSLAHDNDLLDMREARFIFEAVGAVLRFIKSIDADFDTQMTLTE